MYIFIIIVTKETMGGTDMNKVILMGRLTRDPEIRRTAGEKEMCIASYTLAVDRRIRREGDQNTDFINCVAFGHTAEFAQKYFHQGTKIIITGRIQVRTYTNRNNQKAIATEVIIEEQEFAESKSAGDNGRPGTYQNETRGGSQGETSFNQKELADFLSVMQDELPFK